jgi:D-glycerate 3-kinase
MKAQNGGRGMTDDEVKGYDHVLSYCYGSSVYSGSSFRFIDRYLPGYIFFSDGVLRGYAPAEAGAPPDETSVIPPWIGNGLCIVLNLEREVEEVQHF